MITEDSSHYSSEEPATVAKPKLKLPPTTDYRWKLLDDDLQQILSNTLSGSPREKLERMPGIVFNVMEERFEQRKVPLLLQKRWGRVEGRGKITELRKESKSLKRT